MLRLFRGTSLQTMVLTALAVILISFSAFHLKDSEKVYWYDQGHKNYWFKQNDVIAFKLPKESAMPASKHSEDILAIEQSAHFNQKIVQIHLKDHAIHEEQQIATELQRQAPNAVRLPVLTKYPKSSATENQWIIADDHLLVQLKDNKHQEQILERLELEYDLALKRKGEHIHLLKVNQYQGNVEKLLTTAQRLYQDEKVRLAYPNRINLFKPDANDAQIDKAWHVKNDGSTVWCNNQSGKNGADIRMNPVWKAGHLAEGVRVAVIDYHGFDYNHPDMQGRLLPGWDCIQNKPYNASNYYLTDQQKAHGMAVAGIIASNINNHVGSAGIAPKASVIPFLVDGSEAQIIQAIEKAASSAFDADIINMSFGGPYGSSALHQVIQDAVHEGRVNKTDTLGCVVVASHGNKGLDDQQNPQYPSAFQEVISVGATTPEDQRKQKGDGWGATGSWGSNFGDKLDVVAPGVCIITTDITGEPGFYDGGGYVGLSRTSAAAPQVSGIAALLLADNPTLSWQEVREKIRNGADQIGDYSYKQDGKSRETGYGRINATATINPAIVGIEETLDNQNDVSFHLNSPAISELAISLDGKLPKEVTMTIHDLAGRQWLQRSFFHARANYELNVEHLPQGMYLISFLQNDKLLRTKKFVKSR